MALQFFKHEVVSLKGHPDFSEKWVQQRIQEDPSILGLGDVELVGAEKIQPRAGRLDLLLYDAQLDRRYEVELMLGPTDPSHIVRCIEYYDIERRRYPAYGHVAVLVAEDITSRFLNIMAVLAGSIPLIAIQLKALRIDDKIVLQFTRVLDQTELRTDDEFELGERPSERKEADRSIWQNQPALLSICDEVDAMVTEVVGKSHRIQYLKKLINFIGGSDKSARVWLLPEKKVVYLGAYVGDPVEWVKRFEEMGLPAGVRRGNKAARVAVSSEAIAMHRPLFAEFIRTVFDDSNSD